MGKTKFRYLAALLVTSLFCSFNGFFGVKLNGMGFSSYASPLIRFGLSLPFTFLMVFFRDRTLFRIRLRDLWIFFLSGVCGSYLSSLSYFLALRYVSTSITSVLLYTSPIFVTLLSRLLFREKLTAKKLVACALAVLGCALVSGIFTGGAHGLTLMTLGTGLLSGFGYALYSIFGRYAVDRGYHSLTINAWTFLIASVCLAPFVDYGAIGGALAADPLDTVLYSLGLAVVVTVIPYLLYTAGLERISSSRAAILASLEPVVACLVSVTVFGEPLSLLGVLGVLLVLGAVLLLNLHSRRRAPR